MAHLHNLNPTLLLLGKGLSAKFRPDPELSSFEDALRRLEKAEAQSELRRDIRWLSGEVVRVDSSMAGKKNARHGRRAKSCAPRVSGQTRCAIHYAAI